MRPSSRGRTHCRRGCGGTKITDSKNVSKERGETVWMTAGTRHFAWTERETEMQLHGIGPWAVNYVNPADDPRKQ